MVSEIKGITVVPTFAVVNGEVRPILTVIGSRNEALEMREWFDRARGQGKIPSFLWTNFAENEPGSEANKPVNSIRALPGFKQQVLCKAEGCHELVDPLDGWCDIHQKVKGE